MSSSAQRKHPPGPRCGSGTRPAQTAWLNVATFTPSSLATVFVFATSMFLSFNVNRFLVPPL